MANTTNYNWETPDDTDLVKDGAAAIRTLGSSVDTTTKALNPSTTLGDIEYRSATANTNTRLVIGSTGQVLTVAGGVPTWATSDDANAIQNALLTTTGDTIYASGASTPARLGIGTTGQVLTVASGVPSWATPAATTPSFVGCVLTDVSGAITLTNNTNTAITWDTEKIDTDAFHSTGTNPSRITIPTGKGGKYLISAKLAYNSNATGERAVQIYKNGSLVLQMNVKNGLTGTFFTPTNTGVFSAVATDYFEVYGFQNSGGDLAIQPGSAGETLQFSATYLGA
jgi:hypothetical protein